MPILIDAASEFANLCERLASPSRENGAKTLATHFGVNHGSEEFFRLLACVHKRIDQLVSFVEAVPTLQIDYKRAAIGRVNNLRNAFTIDCLTRQWNDGAGGASFLQDANIFPLKMLSSEIGKIASYPKLSPEEIEGALSHVREIQAWLVTQELSEQDFIRQLILEGLNEFRFRLEKLEWVGLGFALESFKDVIAGYLILEGKEPTVIESPDAMALLAKVGAAIRSISSSIGLVKDATEKASFMITALKACATVAQNPTAVGVLSFVAGSATT